MVGALDGSKVPKALFIHDGADILCIGLVVISIETFSRFFNSIDRGLLSPTNVCEENYQWGALLLVIGRKEAVLTYRNILCSGR